MRCRGAGGDAGRGISPCTGPSHFVDRHPRTVSLSEAWCGFNPRPSHRQTALPRREVSPGRLSPRYSGGGRPSRTCDTDAVSPRFTLAAGGKWGVHGRSPGAVEHPLVFRGDYKRSPPGDLVSRTEPWFLLRCALTRMRSRVQAGT